MDRTLLLVVAALLSVALGTGIFSLLKSGQAKRLKERVATAGALQATPAATAGLPSIRLKANETRPFTERVLRFLKFNPDIPQEQVVPWPVVIIMGMVLSAIFTYYFGLFTQFSTSIPIGIFLCFFIIRGVFSWQHNRYVDAIFKQIPDAIGMMVRAVRAGLPVAEAMRSVAAESPSPLRDEFSRILGDVSIGRPVDQAMMRLYSRTELPEFSFLAVTLGMQSQTGGNLAETLDNLADLVRKRVALSKRAKALAAEARMQAGILMVLPYLAALAMSQIQPFYIDQFFRNPSGQRLALIGLGFSVFGFFVIRWMIKRAGMD